MKTRNLTQAELAQCYSVVRDGMADQLPADLPSWAIEFAASMSLVCLTRWCQVNNVPLPPDNPLGVR
jgi:hypothetical protein